MFIDAHCHLQFDGQGLEVIERAAAAGVEKFVCVGADAKTSAEAVALARSGDDRIFATVGLHPHDAKDGLDETVTVLERALEIPDGRIVGIGECGLDYYYEHSPRDVQREVFIRQIYLAKKHNLSLVIHTRDAWNDTFEILRSEGVPPRTVLHCFTGGPDEARTCLDLGIMLSFSGIVTFPSALDVQEAARICPVDRLLFETDSPFLAPVPYRGKTNEPQYISRIAEKISDIKNIQVEPFAETVFRTTSVVFSLQ